MQSNHIVRINIPLTIFLSLMEAPHLTSLPTSPHPPKKVYIVSSLQTLTKGFNGKDDSYLKEREEFPLLLLNPLSHSHEIAE